MALTIAYWNEKRNKLKVNGKVAPETKYDKELKEYEAKRNALEKDPDVHKVDAALAALSELQKTVAPSAAALTAAKFDDLAKQLPPDVTFKKEKEGLEKLKGELGLAAKMRLAGTKEEAVYEALWDVYEKQRDELAKAHSKQLYKNALQTLAKLIAQADKCRTSDQSLNKKYNKLESGLNAFVTSTTSAQQAYEKAIDACAKARKDLLVEFKAAKPKLDSALAHATQLAKDAVQAKTEKNSFKLAGTLKKLDPLEKAALKDFDDVADKFAPSTQMRNSLDVKAAKIHTVDSTAEIAPHFTALIDANKDLLTVKKQLETVIAAVRATKIA